MIQYLITLKFVQSLVQISWLIKTVNQLNREVEYAEFLYFSSFKGH